VPFALGDVKLVLLDTCVPHRLVGSAYNDRRDECARALSVIREQYHIVTALRDTTPAMLAARAGGMDATALRRATHVVDEIDRVRRTVAALEAGDLEAVGGLLNASHESLRDLYEVSCPELEIGRGEGLSVPGVLGGRVTGGGFGGCLIFLVREDSVDRFSRHVHTRYRERTGLTPEIYVTEPRGGVRVRTVVECLGESAD
jgi:galactokinase